MKKLIIFTLMFLFLFSYVSAIRVDYSPNDKGVKDMKAIVKDTILFGLISVGEQGTMELKSHNTIYEKRGVEVNTLTQEVNPAGIGLIYETNFGNEHKDALTDVKIIDMRTGKEVERDWRFVYSSEGQWEIPIYKEVCSKEEQLREEYERNCDWVFDYYEYSPRKVWNIYNNRNIPKGNFELGIEIEVKENDYLDIVLEIQSKKIDKHAQVVEGIAGYIYTGGAGNQSVVKYDSDLNIVAVSPNYGGAIYSISIDDDYVYYGGDTTNKVRKAYKTNLSTITNSPNYGGGIISISLDDDYVYYGGDTTNKVRKAYKTNLSTITDSPSYGGEIYSISLDDDYVYYGGVTTQTVRKAYKTNLTTIIDSPNYGGAILSISIDDDYVYYGGLTTRTVRKAYKSNLATITDSPSYGEIIRSISLDNDYVYYGGDTITVRKAYKTNLTTIIDSPNYGGTINSISLDDDYVYYGGVTTQTVRKAYKTNLTTIIDSPNYGGYILSISLEASSGLEISLLSPIDYYNSSSSTIDFSANLTDEGGLGITNVSLVINDTIYQTNTSGVSGLYSFIEDLDDGYYEWKLVAYDNWNEKYETPLRNLTIDTTSPNILITSPLTHYDYLEDNQSLDLNYTITDLNGVDKCWFIYNNTKTDLNCNTNTTFNYITSNNNITIYANDTFGNTGNVTRSWDVGLVPTNNIYNNISYVSEDNNFHYSFYTDKVVNELYLNYNGIKYPTNYSQNNDIVTSNINLNKYTSPIGNNTFFYEYDSSSSPIYSQEIKDINFYICNASANYSLKINFIDELLLNNINGTLRTSYVEYYIDNDNFRQNKSFLNAESLENYYFCFTPEGKEVNLYISTSYYSAGYPERTGTFDLKLGDNPINITLNLLSESSGIYANYKFIDSVTKQGIPNVHIRIYDGETLVIEKTSDDSGQISEWLNPNILYNVYYEATGYIGRTSTSRPISTDIQLFEMTFIENIISPKLDNGLVTQFYPANSILEQPDNEFRFFAKSGVVKIDNIIMSIYNNDGVLLDTTSKGSEGELLLNIEGLSNRDILLVRYNISGGGERWYFERYYVYVVYDGDYSLFGWLDTYDTIYYPVDKRTSTSNAINYVVWFIASIGAFSLGHSGNKRTREKSLSIQSISNSTIGLTLMTIVTWLFCYFNFIPFPFLEEGVSVFGTITSAWIRQYGIFALNLIILSSKLIWEVTKEK